MNNLNNIEFIFNAIFNYDGLKDKELDEKIKSEIIKRRPRIWNIDTSILTILENFFSHLRLLDKNDILTNDLLIKKSINLNKKNNELFSFQLGDMNITPSTSKNKIFVAKNTMTQYIRILNYFDILIIPELDKAKEIFTGEINFSINLYSFINDLKVDIFLEMNNIINYIVKGFKKDFSSYNDLSFSLLIMIIYELDKKILFSEELKKYNLFFDFRKNKSFKEETKKPITAKEKILKAYNETYGKLVQYIIKDIKNKFINKTNEEILNIFLNNFIISCSLNDLYNFKNTSNKDDLKFYKNNEIQKIVNAIEFEKIISKERSKLRTNILETRNINNDNHYSDLEPIDSKIIFINDCVTQQEAAHIWAVSEIKKDLNLNDSFDHLSDPNNGILMDHIYHDAFDRGWIRFNDKGEMVPNKMWNENYVDKNNKYIKYPLMRIKREVFNECMKKYIQKR